MMFDNKFNKDNTIHFDIKEWECTDPDEFQFCRKVSDTEFEYIQLKDKSMADDVEYNKRALDFLNDKTHPADWWQEEIDVTDYSSKEIAGYLAPYGGILDGVDNEQERNQLIAECIFETDVLTDEIG